MSRSNPWTSASWSSVTPCRTLSSSASAWRCSLLRLGSRGGTAIDTAISESLVDGGRQGDIGYKKHLWRACIEEHPLFPDIARSLGGLEGYADEHQGFC
jgi:hypothetical protein